MRISYKKYTSEPLTVAIYWKKKTVTIFSFLSELHFSENESRFRREYVLETRKWTFIKAEAVSVHLLFPTVQRRVIESRSLT